MDSTIPWNDVIKKEARGTNDYNLGEVQDVGPNWVHTQKGIASKTQFYIPKYLVLGYDGDKLRFNVSETQANEFARNSPPVETQYQKFRTKEMRPDIEQRIPVISERLDVQKRTITEEAVIRKEPVTETKTVEVPVTHERVSVERRPAGTTTDVPREGPVQTGTEYKVPLKREEVMVSKTPEVKEEVVVKKTPVTETRKVTEQVRSERVETTGEGKASATMTPEEKAEEERRRKNKRES